MGSLLLCIGLWTGIGTWTQVAAWWLLICGCLGWYVASQFILRSAWRRAARFPCCETTARGAGANRERLREVGETRWLILALAHLAGAYADLGESAQSETLYREALEIALESGDVRGAAVVRANFANKLRTQGEDERARELREEALAGSRLVGDD